MMTARAEYRLALRADNATSRLGEAAIGAACVSARRRAQIEAHFARRSSASWAETEEGQADALYAPYLERQQREWDGGAARRAALRFLQRSTSRRIPGISTEMAERLDAARPGDPRPGVSYPRRYSRGPVRFLRRRMPPSGMIERLSAVSGCDVSRETFAPARSLRRPAEGCCSAAESRSLLPPSKRSGSVTSSTRRSWCGLAAGRWGTWADIGSGAGLPGMVLAHPLEGLRSH